MERWVATAAVPINDEAVGEGCPTVSSADSYTTAVCAKALTTSDSCKS